MTRLTVTLRQDERAALLSWALDERRDLRDQAAVILRHALIQRGLLSAEPVPSVPATHAAEVNHERVAV